MNLLIRPFTTADYAALAKAATAAYSDAQGQPLVPNGEADMREVDAARAPIVKWGRWVAEVAGEVVGAAEYDQQASRYHPHKFWMDLFVQPEHQGRGIGSGLYQRVLVALQQHQALSARGATREDMGATIRFLQRRGWQEVSRQWESCLDLRTFFAARFYGVEQAVLAQGIMFKTLLELAADPLRDHKLYDLVWEIRQAFPNIDAATRESLDDFVTQRLRAPELLPEAFVVAVRDGEYVGYTSHTRFGDSSDVLRIGQTGVKRNYRHRKIGLALKLRGVTFAQAHGYTYLRTVNESSNQAILAINERMGFVKRPAWIDLVKTFRTETTAGAAGHGA